MKSIFTDKKIAAVFEKEGCVKVKILTDNEIFALKELYSRFQIKDRNNYNSEKPSEHIGTDKLIFHRDQIYKITLDLINKHLQNARPILANFMMKDPNPNSFIPPHQDCTFTDEEEQLYSTVFCWIPLVDTDLKNGAIGVIKGSHKVIEGPSPAWPNPRVPRYHDENVFELFKYLEFFELKAGEALFFNNRTLHGSLANFSKETRAAIRLGFVHKDADLIHYFLNPEGNGKFMSKYKIDEEFPLNYPNEKLVQIYDNNASFGKYEKLDELPFYVSDMKIKDLIKGIKKSGIKIKENKKISEILPSKNDEELDSRMGVNVFQQFFKWFKN